MKCSGCKGSGMKVSVRQFGAGMFQQMQHPCNECIINDKDHCTQYKGEKVVQEKKVMNVIMDKGMQNGQKIIVTHRRFLNTTGATVTYFIFLPYIKKNYDYGVVIFILTFNLIDVSSYCVDSVLKIARDRFYTIAIGCVLCLIMTALVFSNWSGEDLHNSIINRLEGLAKSIEACVSGYFNNEAPDINEDEPEEDPVCLGYKTILDSKSTDETLALHASWEPRNSRQKCFPGKQYVKLGGVIHHFAYTVVSLHGCIKTEIQTTLQNVNIEDEMKKKQAHAHQEAYNEDEEMHGGAQRVQCAQQ